MDTLTPITKDKLKAARTEAETNAMLSLVDSYASTLRGKVSAFRCAKSEDRERHYKELKALTDSLSLVADSIGEILTPPASHKDIVLAPSVLIAESPHRATWIARYRLRYGVGCPMCQGNHDLTSLPFCEIPNPPYLQSGAWANCPTTGGPILV